MTRSCRYLNLAPGPAPPTKAQQPLRQVVGQYSSVTELLLLVRTRILSVWTPTGTTTQPISAASLPLPSGAATAANQTTGNSSLSSIDTKTPALVSGRVPVDGSGVTQPVSATTLPLPSGAATEATLAGVLTTTAFQARLNTLGQKTMANSTPVTLASDQAPLPSTISITAATTATQSQVSASASAVQLLAANSSRKTASVFNNSTLANLHIGFVPGVTLTAFKYRLAPGGSLDIEMGPDGKATWQGVVYGIWSSASGAAAISEET